MFANRFLFLSCPFLLVFALYLSACQNSILPTLAIPPAPGMSLSLTGDECPSIEISAGDQVTWANQAQGPRQITGLTPTGELVFDSGILNQGDSFSFTFPEAGIYTYTCSINQDYTSTVMVEP